MTFALGQAASQAGYRIESHESVGSTNALALERAGSGDCGGLWIVAKRQESGRGRRGRPWATPSGNLAATLLLVEAQSLAQVATLGFVAGLALAEGLARVAPRARMAIVLDGAEAPGIRFELKWPNDVLANGAKLAGILLESTMLGEGRIAVAVGIGVNVLSHPADTPYPATSLAALGAECDAETLFLALSEAWLEPYRLWDKGHGLASIREHWLRHAAGIGALASVRIDGRVVRGVFETIDEDCRLAIRETNGNVVRIAAGDVHFGAVASSSAA